jgi:hypothetical protein
VKYNDVSSIANFLNHFGIMFLLKEFNKKMIESFATNFIELNINPLTLPRFSFKGANGKYAEMKVKL